MKLQILFLASIFCLAVFYCQAQVEKTLVPIEVSVSVKKPEISFYAKSILVDVKITNNLLPGISTKQFDLIALDLDKTLDGKTVEKRETALFKLDEKVLSIGETFETQVDLNKMSWLKNSRPVYINEEKYTPLLLGKYFLTVTVGNCQKVLPEGSLLTVTYRPCESNKIPVDFLTPAKSK